ncbi:N-acetylmuramoyl-L-alanine amidase [Pseudoxanthomonas taiwanensis]|jgi:Negative regulator of beta-lactamase expression|uniref:N-acetylmuramoyl-L-alanine amidase n=1 Tax=Pseudoxanthomonas taiwanensis TaxID=176598 RepID=A0A921TEH4_9GAMM|nr:N-acetylmuramoyl-L-alanine amidase [Pseudoxanthomonas taiwanensis]KAF1689765.1 N-acetylmuramoyl-L-alanine amidase [Pseudoxanthomonas taiwanensis]MBO2468758.1 N-acetylmuramoyl-L-alanine amidase [Xanthomonadaceae bacterium]
MIPRLLLLSLVLLLAACAQAPVRNPLAQWRPSPNHDERRAVAIVIHATEQRSVAESLLTLSTGNSGGPVSAHYLVGEDGTIYQLVEESRRAWHAGGGRWGTITDLNSASIGIELDNDGAEPFPPAQIEALLRLLEDLCTRLGIPRHAVIAHADLAPTRKRDPGIHFPWRRLAEAGFGLWPDPADGDPPPGFDPWLAMEAIGWPLHDRAAAVRAYRRHYRGDEADTLDAEDLRILHSLVQQARRLR